MNEVSINRGAWAASSGGVDQNAVYESAYSSAYEQALAWAKSNKV